MYAAAGTGSVMFIKSASDAFSSLKKSSSYMNVLKCSFSDRLKPSLLSFIFSIYHHLFKTDIFDKSRSETSVLSNIFPFSLFIIINKY